MTVADPQLRNRLHSSSLAEICRRHHVRELAVFGSALGSRFRPESDVDVLVEFEPDAAIGFIALGSLGEELSTLIGRRIDIVPKNGLKARIKDNVLAEAEVFFAT